MNQRKTRNVIKFLCIIVAAFICMALTYLIVSNIFGGRLANASNGITLSVWKEKFLALVLMAGGLTAFCSALWFFFTTFVFKVESAYGAGKRTIWCALAFFAVVISIAVPLFYSKSLNIQVNAMVVSLFIFFSAVLNYWIVTVFTTPLSFKYTPLGATVLLSRFGK